MSAPCPRKEAFGDPPDIFEGGALELTAEHAAGLLQPDLDPVADPDAERPCSCEESERLRARVRELEAELQRLRDEFVDAVAVQSNALAREDAEESESEARALRSDNESHVARCYAAEAEAGVLRERVRKLEAYNARLFADGNAMTDKLESAARALKIELEKSECYRVQAEARVRELENKIDIKYPLDEWERLESEAHALREKIERARDALTGTPNFSAALEALRG